MTARVLTVCLFLLFFVCGCQQPSPHEAANEQKCALSFAPYAPASIEIITLSELKADGSEDSAKLKLFIKTLDSFNSAIKTPCVFRIELYEYAARSPSPLGKRLEIWPDIDLNDVAKNNSNWQDHLRAYEFDLDVRSKIQIGSMYVIEATCMSPLGKRLSAQHKIIYQK